MTAHDTPVPLRVLLLEDNPDDAALAERELEAAGYAVSAEVVDSRDAFVARLHREIDVILSDHALPRFNALQALDVVKQAELDVPFIIVSGVIDEVTAVEAMRRGAADYLLKDRLMRLGPAVEQALQAKRLRAEKERAAAAVRESEARYRLLAEHVMDVICRIALDGTLLYASPSCKALLGYEAGELIGRDAFDLVHPEDVVPLRSWLAAIRAQPLEPRATYRSRRKDGAYVWIEAHGRLLRDPASDGVREIVAVLRDVTERKRFERALIEAKEAAEESERLKSAFLNNMSHEIRTPLTGILGFADVLAEEVGGEHRDLVDAIIRNGRRLRDTLDSVLDLAQLDSGTKAMDLQPMEVLAEAGEALAPLRPLAEAKGLTVALTGTPAFAFADRKALHRIVTNLVDNAVKFTDEGGVTVGVNAEGGAVRVRVVDTGVGISPEFLPHLFDEFKQESEGYARTHEGTGLGLAITRRLVELMGGGIRAESTPGAGSAFTVTLRRVQ